MKKVALPLLDFSQINQSNGNNNSQFSNDIFSERRHQELKQQINQLKQERENASPRTVLPNKRYDINALSNDEAIIECDLALVQQTLRAQITQSNQFILSWNKIKQNDTKDLQHIYIIAQEIIRKVKFINKCLEGKNIENQHFGNHYKFQEKFQLTDKPDNVSAKQQLQRYQTPPIKGT